MLYQLHEIETTINILLERLKKNNNMKIIGLDIGKRNIGIATGHFSINIALPYKVIRSTSLIKNTENILGICKINSITDIVIGIPLQHHIYANLAKYIINLARALATTKLIHIYFQDESFSSCIANELLKETGLNRRKRGKFDDAVAATIILNNFFERVNRYQTQYMRTA